MRHDKLYRHAPYGRHDALRQPIGVVEVARDQGIHADRYGNQNMFRSQAVICVEALFLGDDGGQEARGVCRESDADFLLRANFRSNEKRQKKKADHQETKRGLLHDSVKTSLVHTAGTGRLNSLSSSFIIILLCSFRRVARFVNYNQFDVLPAVQFINEFFYYL